MDSKIFKIKGMHCASCASIIEKTLKKVEGVNSIEVNPGTEKAKIDFDSNLTNLDSLSKHIEPLGYSIINDQKEAEAMGMTMEEHAAHTGIGQSKKKS